MDNLLNYSLCSDPLVSFSEWYEAALKVEQNAPVMSVATYDSEKGRPTTRVLLFKGMHGNQLSFYTNYSSPKSKDLEHNSEVCLNFFWHVCGRQVRIHGKAVKMSHEDSEKYFHSRDRDSQIASYISHQSSVIEDKEALMEKFEKTKKQFENKIIPCPENWGGYLVAPYEMEFFLYGINRINDRFLFQLKNNKWEVCRLQP
jgi:pyridoxamine 5'-phosphate oxidase